MFIMLFQSQKVEENSKCVGTWKSTPEDVKFKSCARGFISQALNLKPIQQATYNHDPATSIHKSNWKDSESFISWSRLEKRAPKQLERLNLRIFSND